MERRNISQIKVSKAGNLTNFIQLKLQPKASKNLKSETINFKSFPYLCRPPKESFGLKFRIVMARVCQVTGKTPMRGHKVSHSNVKTKRRFLPNLQTKRYFLVEEDKWITLKVSSEAIRTINKKGLYKVVKELRANGQHIN